MSNLHHSNKGTGQEVSTLGPSAFLFKSLKDVISVNYVNVNNILKPTPRTHYIDTPNLKKKTYYLRLMKTWIHSTMGGKIQIPVFSCNVLNFINITPEVDK